MTGRTAEAHVSLFWGLYQTRYTVSDSDLDVLILASEAPLKF